MAVLPIVKLFQPNLWLPDTCLRKICKEVTKEDLAAEWFPLLVKDMLETLYKEASGVGLSANQVGVLKKISVIDFKRDGKSPLILINPVISPLSGETVYSSEVCLSFPNLSVRVPRYKTVKLVYQDMSGTCREQTAEGFRANVFQHEVSHLCGKSHVDLAESPENIEYYPGTASRKAEMAYQNSCPEKRLIL